MKFLLKLKHWQLFLLIWGVPTALSVISNSNVGLSIIVAFPLMMLFFVFGLFGWVWAIATGLHEKVRPEVKQHLTTFKITFLIPIVYIAALLVWMSFFAFDSSGEQSDPPVIFIVLFVVMHLVSMACIIMGLRYAAKTMRSVELHRAAKFGDYIGEFFLIWFSVVGIWILQPRLNKLMEDHTHDEVHPVTG
jgi:hypothetical protein